MPTDIAVLVDLAQTNLFIIIMIINTIFFNENLLGPCLAQPRRISSQVELHDSSPPHSSPHKFRFMLGTQCDANQTNMVHSWPPVSRVGHQRGKCVAGRSPSSQTNLFDPDTTGKNTRAVFVFTQHKRKRESSVPQFTATPYTSCPDVNTSCSTLYDFVGTYH